MLIAQKTPVLIVKSKRQKRGKPGWINGTLESRSQGIKKLFVYHYNRQGQLLCTIMPVKHIRPVPQGRGQLQLGL